MTAKRTLIVGAGGFIGGFIASRALALGHDTWVAVRQSTSRRYLTDERLHFVVLDYDDVDTMTTALTEAAAQAGGCWDYIIYNLGATKCANFADFNRINYDYLRRFTGVLTSAKIVPERFLYMSSLSALGPAAETPDYPPLNASTIPQPNTRYGLSKMKAEMHLRTMADFPWIIFRPTGVYGPHELDYLMMIQCIDRHWDFSVGFRKQMLTFIYVEDLVNAMFDALDSSATLHGTYIISENRAYTQADFRHIVAEELHRRCVIPVCLPMWAVYAASFVAEKWGLLRCKPSTLNRDKFRIMRQRNWNCDISDAVRDFGFTPKFDLRKGLQVTISQYLANK
jgi:nucleoside-diphosphate-sugar epimerase